LMALSFHDHGRHGWRRSEQRPKATATAEDSPSARSVNIPDADADSASALPPRDGGQKTVPISRRRQLARLKT
jgi:hypothetical protein